MNTLILSGCKPEPLSSYLKGLGVFRLVTEQADPKARSRWTDAGLEIETSLNRQQLVEFLASTYRPTPLISPWNGGSGFYQGDQQSGIQAIEQSTTDRFATYRAAIHVGRKLVEEWGLEERPTDERKRAFVDALRSRLPEEALEWIDAAVVVSDERLRYPPLLGTGGIDARLEFTNNQMQWLAKAFLSKTPPNPRIVEATIFGEPVRGVDRSVIGQFSPAQAGGRNATAGFERDSLASALDFILSFEGAVLFACSASRQLDSGVRSGAFPFVVESTGGGYPSSILNEKSRSRAEVWLPLWSRPTCLIELRRLLSEGRVSVGRRPAQTGTDFARAIAELGIDRGIVGFSRFGFYQRNGDTHLAVSIGRWRVRRNVQVDLLAPFDEWTRGFRNLAIEKRCPSAIQRSLQRLDSAVLDLCRIPNESTCAGEVLQALGAAEGAMSLRRLHRPVPALGPSWLDATQEDSVEYRLARSLASAGFREALVLVRWDTPWRWLDQDDRQTVWSTRPLVANLLEVLHRRDLATDSDHKSSRVPKYFAALGDISAFLDQQVDEARLESWLRGLSLIDWRKVPTALRAVGPASPSPSLLFALTATVFHRLPRPNIQIPRTAGLLRRAAAGDASGCASLCLRRLRSHGLQPAVTQLTANPTEMRRVAAAFAFPLSQADRLFLLDSITQPSTEKEPVRDHSSSH